VNVAGKRESKAPGIGERVEHDPGSDYRYKIVVLSRWPVRGGPNVPVRTGTAVDVRVERPGRPHRLLVVDGQSQVTRSRTPLLLDVAGACRRAADEGAPFDAVVGDFNAVGRSLGFDAVRAAAGGYELASRSCAGWRGTWPVPLPVYDIDHVWVRAGVQVLSCSLFTSPASDHRGQLVCLRLPGGARREPRHEPDCAPPLIVHPSARSRPGGPSISN
jgi:vancomycin resistance protein VanJ